MHVAHNHSYSLTDITVIRQPVKNITNYYWLWVCW